MGLDLVANRNSQARKKFALGNTDISNYFNSLGLVSAR
jgi:hypothetical protein